MWLFSQFGKHIPVLCKNSNILLNFFGKKMRQELHFTTKEEEEESRLELHSI